MRLTVEIANAIRKAVDELGSQQELARRSGVSYKNISKYINNGVKNIRENAWDKLTPFIAKYLSYNDIAVIGCVQFAEKKTDINKEMALFIQWLKSLGNEELMKILSIYAPLYSKGELPSYWSHDPDILLVLTTHPCLMPGTAERLIREFQNIKENPKDQQIIQLQSDLIKLNERQIAQLQEEIQLQKKMIGLLEEKISALFEKRN